MLLIRKVSHRPDLRGCERRRSHVSYSVAVRAKGNEFRLGIDRMGFSNGAKRLQMMNMDVPLGDRSISSTEVHPARIASSTVIPDARSSQNRVSLAPSDLNDFCLSFKPWRSFGFREEIALNFCGGLAQYADCGRALVERRYGHGCQAFPVVVVEPAVFVKRMRGRLTFRSREWIYFRRHVAARRFVHADTPTLVLSVGTLGAIASASQLFSGGCQDRFGRNNDRPDDSASSLPTFKQDRNPLTHRHQFSQRLAIPTGRSTA